MPIDQQTFAEREQELLKYIEELKKAAASNINVGLGDTTDTENLVKDLELLRSVVGNLEAELAEKNEIIEEVIAERDFALEQLQSKSESENSNSSCSNENCLSAINKSADSQSESAALIAEYEKELESMMARCDEYEAEALALRQNIDSQVLEKTKILEDQLAAAKEANASLEEQVNDLCNKCTAYEADSGELETIRAELVAAKNIIEEQEASCGALKAELDKYLSMSVAEASMTAKVNELKNLLEVAELKIRERDAEVKSLKDLTASLRSELNNGHLFSDSLRQDIERERSEISVLLGKKDGEISRLMGEVKELEQRAKLAESNSIRLQMEAVNGQADEETYRKKMNQLQTNVDLLKGERDSLLAKKDVAESKCKELLGLIESAETRVRTLEQKLMATESTGNSTDSKRFMDSIRALEDRLAKERAEKTEVVQSLDAAQKALRDNENKIFELKVKLERFSSMQSMQSSLDRSSEEISSLRQLLDSKSSDLIASESRLKKSKDTVAMLNEEISNMQTSIRNLENQLAEAEAKAIESERLTIEQQSLISELEAEIEQNGTGGVESAAALMKMEETVEKLQMQLDKEIESKTQALASLAITESKLADAIEQHETLDTALTDMNNLLLEKEETILSYARDVETLQAKLSENGSSNNSEQIEALINELNTLMEVKVELEAKVITAEKASKDYRNQLAEYDQASRREQDILMEAAQAEMDSLRNDYETRIEALQISAQNSEELASEVDSLKEQISQRDEFINKCKAEMKRLRSLADASSRNESAIEEVSAQLVEAQRTIKDLHRKVQHLETEKEEMLTKLERSEQSLAAALEEKNKLSESINTITVQHTEVLKAKDSRIKHLEASKLTQDQLERIKVIGAERKKYQEDAKALKKQLAALKTAYENLQAQAQTIKSDANAARSSTSFEEVSALQGRLNEATMQLENYQDMIEALKEKLKDCARQLRVYENEKTAVTAIFEKLGIEPSNHHDMSSSVSDESILPEYDLAEGVSAIVARLNKMEASVAHSTKDKCAVEEKTSALAAELFDVKAQKNATERRLESQKAALKEAKEEIATLTEEIETLRLRLSNTIEDLQNTRNSVNSADSETNSELQVLQEENIELMQENKELRRECALYRAQIRSGLTDSVAGSSLSKHEETKTPDKAVISSNVGDKRKFGTELAVPNPNVVEKPSASLSKTPVATAGGHRKTRVVKAKVVESAALVSTGADAENPGECAQS
jgi:chromosome segregation ATPase